MSPFYERILELRTALNTGAGLNDPAMVYKFQVLLDEFETCTTPASEQPDTRVCKICDGGPGNECACTCPGGPVY